MTVDDDKHTERNLDPWMLVRYGLVGAGTAMATHAGMGGTIDQAVVEQVVGGIMSAAGVAWGVYVRWRTAAVPVQVAAAPDIPVKDSLTGKVKTGPGV
jgi:hypothetical protein